MRVRIGATRVAESQKKQRRGGKWRQKGMTFASMNGRI